MAKKASRGTSGNFVSEWFGHRIHPNVVSNAQAVADQTNERCPFLSAATGENRACIKNPQSKGVCSVSCVSNGPRQDWLVCPYRALSPEIVAGAVRRLFGLETGSNPFVTPAVNLVKSEVRDDILSRLQAGQPVFTYFDEKMGGELSIPADRSVARVRLRRDDRRNDVGQRARAYQPIWHSRNSNHRFSWFLPTRVRNLKDGLRLHPAASLSTLQDNQHWLSEGVEGPNIANVFKRTFYQMMFKFQLGHHDRCAGCVLAIPQSVWDSWQRHLGAPTLVAEPDGTHSLLAPGRSRPIRGRHGFSFSIPMLQLRRHHHQLRSGK